MKKKNLNPKATQKQKPVLFFKKIFFNPWYINVIWIHLIGWKILLVQHEIVTLLGYLAKNCP